MVKRFWFVLFSLFLVDQLIKGVAKTNVTIQLIPNFISFSTSYNKGASFGILQEQTTFLIIFSFLVLGVIAWHHKKITPDMELSVALITSGTISNLIDRIMYGHVVDYLSVGAFPVFNLADAGISLGALWLILILVKKEKK